MAGILEGYLRGVEGAKQIANMKKQNELFGLRNLLAGQVAEGGFNPSESLDFQQYSVLDPQGAAATLANYEALDDSRKRAMFQDAQEGLRLLESERDQDFLDLAVNRNELIKKFKGDSSDTESVINSFLSGDRQGVIQQLQLMKQAGIDRGYLADPRAQEEIDLTLQQKKLGILKAQQDLVTPKINPEFLKEERAFSRDTVKAFNKRSSEIQSSFKKIENILKGDNLNRMQIASAMTSMARLLSPGIVTNEDFRNLSDSTTPIATVIETIRSRRGEEGVNVADELQKFYDPTNPRLFDRDRFMNTARSVIGAEIPSLVRTYEDAEARARRAGISERAMDTNFGESKQLAALKELMPVINHPILGNVTESQIQEAMKNKKLTREQVIAKLQEQ